MKNFIHHMVAKYNTNGNGTMGGGLIKTYIQWQTFAQIWRIDCT